MAQFPPPGGVPGYPQYPAPYPLSGWWRRAGATVVDVLILVIPLGVVLAIARVTNVVASQMAGQLLFSAYVVLMLGSSGQTLGNRAVGTQVLDATTGWPVRYSKAVVRSLVAVALNFSIVGGILDFLWPLWDPANQTLHDKAAGTVVVRVQ